MARVVVRAVTARRPRTRYRVGAISKGLVMTRRVLPDRGWDAAMRVGFRAAAQG